MDWKKPQTKQTPQLFLEDGLINKLSEKEK